MELLLTALNSQMYLLYLIGIMIATGIIKEYNLFSGLYSKLTKKIKSKKLLMFIYSGIGGILPIPGRCVVSASLIDTIATEDKAKRQKFGLVDYLSTHHYYFWSPLEKTVIIPMAALGLTYLGFIQLVLPLLIVYLLFSFIYIKFFVSEDDLEIKPVDETDTKSCWHVLPLILGIVAMIVGFKACILFMFVAMYYIVVTNTYNLKKLGSYINWKLVGLLSAVLFASTYAKAYVGPFVEDMEFGSVTFGVCSLAFIFAFLMGSSSKFAGIVAMASSVFGVITLPLFFAIEFAGYLISPTHKCVVISKEYFGTKFSTFYGVVGGLALLMIGTGVATTLLLR